MKVEPFNFHESHYQIQFLSFPGKCEFMIGVMNSTSVKANTITRIISFSIIHMENFQFNVRMESKETNSQSPQDWRQNTEFSLPDFLRESEVDNQRRNL